MRRAEIPLTTEKLPTEKPADKDLARTSEMPAITSLHFIDPLKLFRSFMATSKAQMMHRGMAHFVDLPTELYHSLSWASSVRSTSGEYAHIQQDDEEETGELIPGPTIFPSDFVLYDS